MNKKVKTWVIYFYLSDSKTRMYWTGTGWTTQLTRAKHYTRERLVKQDAKRVDGQIIAIHPFLIKD